MPGPAILATWLAVAFQARALDTAERRHKPRHDGLLRRALKGAAHPEQGKNARASTGRQ